MKYVYIVTSILSCFSIYGSFPSSLKIASALFVGIAMIDFMLHFKTDNLKTIGEFFVEYSKYIIIMLLVSLIVYINDLSATSLIIRGFEKIFYQVLTILVALFAVYEFKDEAVDYTYKSFAIFNFLCMILALKDTGNMSQVVADIQYFLTSGGDAVGYMKMLELHEVTFCFGLFIIYYLVESPKKNWKKIAISMFFFLVGMKRAGLLGLGGAMFYWLLVKNNKQKKTITSILMWGFVIFSFGYVMFVRSGAFVALMNELDIDLMGRQNLYQYIEDFYTVSPFFTGHGFESIKEILAAAGDIKVNETLISKLTALHNDYLAMYIQMGFFGFFAWMWYRFVDITNFCWKYGEKAFISCTMCSVYAGITYMTDNTAMYFYMVMMGWMIPLAFAVVQKKEEKTTPQSALAK